MNVAMSFLVYDKSECQQHCKKCIVILSAIGTILKLSIVNLHDNASQNTGVSLNKHVHMTWCQFSYHGKTGRLYIN